jgi:hypothetical protein
MRARRDTARAPSIRPTRKGCGRLSPRHEVSIERPDKLAPWSICPGGGEHLLTSTHVAIAVPFLQKNSCIQGTIMELRLACCHL